MPVRSAAPHLGRAHAFQTRLHLLARTDDLFGGRVALWRLPLLALLTPAACPARTPTPAKHRACYRLATPATNKSVRPMRNSAVPNFTAHGCTRSGGPGRFPASSGESRTTELNGFETGCSSKPRGRGRETTRRSRIGTCTASRPAHVERAARPKGDTRRRHRPRPLLHPRGSSTMSAGRPPLYVGARGKVSAASRRSTFSSAMSRGSGCFGHIWRHPPALERWAACDHAPSARSVFNRNPSRSEPGSSRKLLSRRKHTWSAVIRSAGPH